MPIKVIEKAACTACAACVNICPNNAVQLEADGCGFHYPKVKMEQCISCGQCEQVCPALNKLGNGIPDIHELEVYAAFSKNDNVRYASASGGIFSELSLPVLECKGLVAGVGFLDPYTPAHCLINSSEELPKLRKSKYVQSEIGLLFREVAHHLTSGKQVLFSGTPCQTAGLYNYLGKNYENLILVDIICHGVNSPKAYTAWLKEVEAAHGGQVLHVEFRHKIDGWRKSVWRTKIGFDDGSSIVVHKTEGTFMGGFLKGELYLRPSCGVCKFKGRNRVSDITIGDFWGAPADLNDDRGLSLIVINSAKGARLFDEIKPRITFYKRSYKDVLENNPMYQNSAAINLNSHLFLSSLGERSFSELMGQYLVL